FNGDGLQALGTQLNDPSGIALDAAGDLYIADTRNHRIRRVDAATGIVTTVAGNGLSGAAGDGGPAVQAQLSFPVRVEVDAAGNLYIVDGFTSETDSGGKVFGSRGGKIRRVDAASGIISTFAGDGVLGFHGDGGPAAVAGLGGARGIAFDAAGNLLVASYEAGRVRKIDLPVPPTAGATATPAVLWPPNHQMVEVHVDVDTGSTPGPLTIVLDSIDRSEPDDAPGGSDGSTVDDVQGADYGTEDYDFELRAERSGSGGGRVYAITYVVTSASGLSVEATAFVTVPHDMGGVVDPVSLSIEETPSGSLLSWSEVPGANSYSIIRGDLGSLAELPDAIDLGAVSCVVSRTKELTTAGAEDAEIPESGHGWFYLGEYRDPHASSYGSPFAPEPRSPAGGACN
ncbi:MAG TPA: hypothetical protein VNI57_00080, partial [Candidatus Saccharimonadales bacterium]|nr:hypothetical protein [Candidatus Saccharimonadales bacterium]